MRIELERALVLAHPALYHGHSEHEDGIGDPRRTLMCFGFECGDGWYQVLSDFADQASLVAEWTGGEITFTQIKEKYGTLRLYFAASGVSSVAHDILMACEAAAEYRSAHTCESCGDRATAEIRSTSGKPGGWLACRCDACAARDGYKEIVDGEV